MGWFVVKPCVVEVNTLDATEATVETEPFTTIVATAPDPAPPVKGTLVYVPAR